MPRVAIVAIAVLALGRIAHADPAADEQAVRAAAKAFVTALGASDDAAIAKAFAPTVKLSILHYASMGCDKTYSGKKSIKRRAAAQLARCLYQPGGVPADDTAFVVTRTGGAFEVDTDATHTYRFRKRGKAYVIDRISGLGMDPAELQGLFDQPSEGALDVRH